MTGLVGSRLEPASLIQQVQDDAGLWLRRASRLLPGVELTIAHAAWSMPRWSRALPAPGARGLLYVRPLHLDLEILADGSSDTAAVVVRLPWLVDDQAAAEPEAPQLGVHRGLWCGRPLVVHDHARPRAGLHLLADRSRTRSGGEPRDTRYRFLLVPDVGRAQWLRRPKRGWAPSEPRDSATRGEIARSFALHDSTREAVREVLTSLGIQVDDDQLEDRQSLGALVRPVLAALGAQTAASGVVHPLARLQASAAVNEVQSYHHLLRRLVVDGLRDGVAAWVASTGGQDRGPVAARRLAAAVTSGLDAQVRRLATASGSGFGPLVHPVMPTNTLARVEADRTVTFLGAGGLGHRRGRLDLRDLTPDWNGVLCPVQSPESTAIGFVRFRAGGAGDGWSDVSVAASLIPFLDHDEPARSSIGSKNLKQAIPLVAGEPPLVRTGAETVVAEAGVVRSLADGRVLAVDEAAVVVQPLVGPPLAHPIGVPEGSLGDADMRWRVCVEVGHEISTGEVLAHAPDVALEGGRPILANGVNAFVVMTPWEGLSYEDGLVVSESFAARLTSRHVLTLTRWLAPDDDVIDVHAMLGPVPTEVRAGVPLVNIEGSGRDGRPGSRVVLAPEDARYLGSAVDRESGVLEVRLEVARPLAVGDKLTTRHGGKGVVVRVVPDAEMPFVADEEDAPAAERGRAADMIMNPLGTLRRLNIGQWWEMHEGLLAELEGRAAAVVGRTADADHLSARLAASGAPRGRLPLRVRRDGEVVPVRSSVDDRVVAGPQYVVKLLHRAGAKLSVRGDDESTSLRTMQPSPRARDRGGRLVGAAQRLGEMESWALQARGATEVVADLLSVRSVPPRLRGRFAARPTLVVADAHLAATGMRIVLETADAAGGLRREHASDVDAAITRTLRDAFVRPIAGVTGWSLYSVDDIKAVARLPRGPKTVEEVEGSPLYGRAWWDEDGPGSLCPSWAFDISGDALVDWRELWGSPVIPVLPPAYRVPGRSDLDSHYARLARLLLDHRDVMESATAVPDVRLAAQESHLRRFRAIVEQIREGVGGPGEALWGPQDDRGNRRYKKGLLHRHLLGAAANLSARAVIVGDPDLPPTHVVLPRDMVEQLEVAAATPDDPFADVVIVNRSPTLHPYNLLAFRALAAPDTSLQAIVLPHECLGALAGDFDGDTVAIHRPATAEARRQAWELMRLAVSARTAANGALLVKVDQEAMLGLVLAQGQAQDAAEVEQPAVRGATADDIGAALDWEFSQREVDPDHALAWLHEARRAGLAAATGWSLGALDLVHAPTWSEDVDLAAWLGGGSSAGLDLVRQAWAAGAAGSADGLSQLLRRRGTVPGLNALLPPEAFEGSLLRGLQPGVLPGAARGSLAGLAEKKLLTPLAGGLTQSLVEMAGEVVVSDGDCDAAIRSPLQCRAGEFEVCPACVGMLMTGRPAQPGDAIGVLAAMLIGERSTQAAMKAFHAGGTHRTAVRATLHRTRARLGRGVLLDSDGAEWRLSSVFDHALSAEDHDAVLAAAESVGAEIARDLGVDPTLVAVVMRQLVDAARLRRTSGGGRDLVWWAERRGRGELDRLIGRGLPRSGVPLALYGPMGNPANGTGLARLSFATGLEVRA